MGAMKRLMSGSPGKGRRIQLGSGGGAAHHMDERIGADWGRPPPGTLRVEGRCASRW